jgi:FAD/FMN-containing dehydrogenase
MLAEPPPECSRRTFLVQALATAGAWTAAPLAALAAPPLRVDNVTGLYGVEVARIATPASTDDVIRALRNWHGKVAIGGGRFSMGGQVGIVGGLHLDMRGMRRVVWFRPQDKRVRVQAGISWRDLQDVLDAQDLSVRTMQSYANFTVGGAVSVNAHGRYVGHGPMGQSVRALQLVLADGRVVEADREHDFELMRAALGGYGAVGVITEVELELDENAKMERRIESVRLSGYPDYFARHVLEDHSSVMHNADLLPPRFDAPVAITWHATSKPLTRKQRLIPRGQSYKVQRDALWAITTLPYAAKLRGPAIEVARRVRPEVAWRNHEASLDVASLEPYSRKVSTYALNEFFVPPRHFESFAREMALILQNRRVEAVNVSIRHSPADTLSLLPWAREEVFSFVLFYKQRNTREAQRAVGVWTRELIDATLRHDGRYYLPYQLHATKEQFERAYPEVAKLRQLKRDVDPNNRFSNELWRKYL